MADLLLERPRGPTTRTVAARAVRIVVVDDDASHAYRLADLLELPPIGAFTRAFSDPKRAFFHMQEHPPDLLVASLKMRRIHGWELIRRLRATLGHVPCILVADDGRAGGVAAEAFEGVRVLVKPVQGGTLVRAVRAALYQDPHMARQVAYGDGRRA